jgi:hypothetical protein
MPIHLHIHVTRITLEGCQRARYLPGTAKPPELKHRFHLQMHLSDTPCNTDCPRHSALSSSLAQNVGTNRLHAPYNVSQMNVPVFTGMCIQLRNSGCKRIMHAISTVKRRRNSSSLNLDSTGCMRAEGRTLEGCQSPNHRTMLQTALPRP